MILILNEELPKYCFECPCFNDEYGRCQVKGNWMKGYVYNEIPDWCTLREVSWKKTVSFVK